MSKTFDYVPRPIDAKHTKSSIESLMGTEEYIKYCADNNKIQDYWRTPEWLEHPINTAMNQPVPIVASNINAGDIFNLSSSVIQIAFVSKKITNIQGMIPTEKRKPSVHPNGDYLSYDISGDIGGFWYNQPHNRLTEGFFVWLPIPHQLLAIGMMEEFQKLCSILEQTIERSK